LPSAELYDPSTQVWTLTSSFSPGVGLPTPPALLTNGDALIANDAQFYTREKFGEVLRLEEAVVGQSPND
jgi:hypothetical protein